MPENDPAKARLFIAIELTSDVKGELSRLQERLKKACGFCPAKWVPADKIHLTLNFLGDVALFKLDDIKVAVEQVGAEFAPFELALTSPGAFPNLNRPHVVWVGLNGVVDKLSSLQKRLEELLAGLGFQPEDSAFFPHLTLARVRDEASPADRKKLGEAIAKTLCEKDCTITVDSISLIQSRLAPDGTIYAVLYSAPLKT